MKIIIGAEFANSYLTNLQNAFPECEFVMARTREDIFASITDSVVFVGNPDNDIINAGNKLQWVQMLKAGADAVNLQLIKERNIVLTSSSGVSSVSVAEHALAMMFSFARALPELQREQRNETWRKGHTLPIFNLEGQTLGIVGMGSIGTTLATKAKALGLRVLGARKNATKSHPSVDRMYGIDQLIEMVSIVDHLVVCLPSTPETHDIIDASVFNVMKPTSFFYNVGRGTTVNTNELLAALDRIAGAGIDCANPEPLPKGHVLWHHPKVIMTSHTGGHTPQHWERTFSMLSDNMYRFTKGEPLLNIIDLNSGY